MLLITIARSTGKFQIFLKIDMYILKYAVFSVGFVFSRLQIPEERFWNVLIFLGIFFSNKSRAPFNKIILPSFRCLSALEVKWDQKPICNFFGPDEYDIKTYWESVKGK